MQATQNTAAAVVVRTFPTAPNLTRRTDNQLWKPVQSSSSGGKLTRRDVIFLPNRKALVSHRRCNFAISFAIDESEERREVARQRKCPLLLIGVDSVAIPVLEHPDLIRCVIARALDQR